MKIDLKLWGDTMSRSRRIGLILLLLSSGFSTFWAILLQRRPYQGITDFRIIYIAAQCLVQHRDPYQESEFLRIFYREGGQLPNQVDHRQFQHAVMAVVYLPTALLLLAPFAVLSWTAAQGVWTILTIGLFTLACCLVWIIASDSSPPLALCLCAIMLANAEVVFAFGNAAGIAVSLCVIGVCAFVTNRFALAGALCLAMSLALKPHDSFAIWLYFFLVGGFYRKQVLKTLVAVVVLSVPAFLWVAHISPDWIWEFRSNLAVVGAKGGITDPGPGGASNRTGGMIINLQSAASIVHDDPRAYNLVTYAVCAPLFLVWLFATLRTKNAHAQIWLSLASLVPLSLLPVYHRVYDAKLLLLAIPACALIWNRGGPRRWIVLTTTSAAILFTSDIPESLLVMVTKPLPMHPVGLSEKLRVIFLARSIPLLLLAMCISFLWEYFRQSCTPRTEAETAISVADQRPPL
jgi:hypothetical protein